MRHWHVWGVTAAVWLSGVWVCLNQGLYWTGRPGALLLVSVWLIAGAVAAGGWAILSGFGRSVKTGFGSHELGPYELGGAAPRAGLWAEPKPFGVPCCWPQVPLS